MAKIKRFTPAPAAQCPVEDPTFLLDQNNDEFDVMSDKNNGSEPILNYLNRGGTLQNLMDHLPDKWKNHMTLSTQDLTGDGVPELMASDMYNWYVIGCMSGAYSILLESDSNVPDFDTRPHVIYAKDMNLDGLPEIVVKKRAAAGSTNGEEFDVYEWDGSHFKDLVPEEKFSTPYQSVEVDGPIWTDGIYQFEVKDIDHNGTIEFILTAGLPTTADELMNGPWRWETATFMWNGQTFAPYSFQVQPPVYRFQALQDADFAFESGDYAHALDLYQQVIFSDKLDWWSDDRAYYIMQKVQAEYSREPTPPTPIPTPMVDPSEYTYLSAYAYYRIILVYTVQNQLAGAKTVYATMQSKYPADHPSHMYVDMASAFLNTYLATANLGESCAKVLEYTNSNDVITPLNGSYGYQSRYYSAQEMCPFQ